MDANKGCSDLNEKLATAGGKPVSKSEIGVGKRDGEGKEEGKYAKPHICLNCYEFLKL